jgi:hypothetical protein
MTAVKGRLWGELVDSQTAVRFAIFCGTFAKLTLFSQRLNRCPLTLPATLACPQRHHVQRVLLRTHRITCDSPPYN